MAEIRDFIYLDVPRLLSFDSQLFEGLAESKTRSGSKAAEFSGSVKGKIPLFAEATADTKATLLAGDSTTVAVHQDQLVVQVIEGLRDQGFLWGVEQAANAPDGAFVLLSGRVQLTDPESLREIVEGFPDLMANMQALQDPQAPARTPADRRAGRSLPANNLLPKGKAKALAELFRRLARDTVRLRLLEDGEPIATGVVQRRKFVESLDELTTRHGFLLGGTWRILAQVNEAPGDDFYVPEARETLLDLVEAAGLTAMRAYIGLSGVWAGAGLRVTPLAIYREIQSRK